MQRAAQVGQSCCISAWQLDSPGLLTREEVLPAELKDKTAETVAGRQAASLYFSLCTLNKICLAPLARHTAALCVSNNNSFRWLSARANLFGWRDIALGRLATFTRREWARRTRSFALTHPLACTLTQRETKTFSLGRRAQKE
jgi:hypothetical protein